MISRLRLAAIVGAMALVAGCYPAYGSGGGGKDRNECASSHPGRGRGLRELQVVGLTADHRLICFDEDEPGDAEDIGAITGLMGDTSLLGIDFRPATGELIGIGNAGGIYTLDPASAAATKKSQLSGATLSGSFFGVDFNPVVDRLRVISDTGQNLRIDVTTGVAAVDTALSYTPGTTATGVVGAAYTNNDADPNTNTTLFDIDSMLDQVAIQSPANSGTLVATGKLGVDTSPVVGEDIFSFVSNGTTVDVVGFASLTTGSQSSFYRLNLLTGKAENRGSFEARNQVTGIAVPLNQA